MKKILLIEDNTEIRENMAEILELSGYEAITAPDGRKGVSLALETKPDIIVCDIMMPELDGYGVIHMLQKNPSTQNIPFIFLTAKAERAEIRKGMELGADDYLTKPFNGTELLNAIESRLKKSEALKQQLSPGLEGLNTLIHASGSDLVKNLAETADTSVYKKRQIIYHEGGQPYRLYYVQSGKVKTYKTNDDGKELITGLHGEGDFFGHIAILEGTPYKENAEAMEDAEVAMVPREQFETLVNGNPAILKKFVGLLAKNVSEKEEQLLGLAYNSLRKKVANALIALHDKYKPADGKEFSIDISRDNLSTIAGTAKESLIRTLGDFKDEKLIEVKSGVITILQAQKLRNLIN
ncbi:MAG: transcriptional regulator [Flavipsychrobacter sp.]|jgi:CRP-like cAMP-binding protein|nr:transcriptional regulator [Flavipsychrobacter sp.]